MKYLLFLVILIGAITFNANDSFAQTTTTVSKKCGKCGKSVSTNSRIGDICPHCGVRWGYENTTTTSTTVARPKYENYIHIYSPSTNGAKTSTTKTNNNTTPPKPNPFASYTKQMTEQWLLQRFKEYAKKRVYCSSDPILSIGGCTTYDDFEFKFDSEYLIVKYNYNNEYNTIVYIPLYDFSYAYGQTYGSDFGINTTSNTMYEVNRKYNSKRVTNYISIGFKNDAETDLIENIELALKHLKKYYKKPTTAYLPEFVSQTEINKPSLSETQSWILSKLNTYQKTLSGRNGVGSYSNFSFSFSGFNLIINFKETSSMRAYGYDNTWTHYYIVTVPICECSSFRPSNNQGGNLGFSTSVKNITKVEQGRSTDYISSFDISIDSGRENDLINRLQKAFNNLKTYCPTQAKPKEVF